MRNKKNLIIIIFLAILWAFYEDIANDGTSFRENRAVSQEVVSLRVGGFKRFEPFQPKRSAVFLVRSSSNLSN